MTSDVAKTIPDRVMNFGSSDAVPVEQSEDVITPDNLESHAKSFEKYIRGRCRGSKEPDAQWYAA